MLDSPESLIASIISEGVLLSGKCATTGMTSSGCDAASVCANDAPNPENVVLLESVTLFQIGIGVNRRIARMNIVEVDLLIAGIILCPSEAPLTSAKIRLFLHATLYQF